MAHHTIEVNSFEQALKEYNEYIKSLNRKLKVFTERLANRGILIAESEVAEGYIGHIRFSTSITDTSNGYKAVMLATDLSPIVARWQTKEGIKEADVSALLMSEFGSGQYAVEGHRGTFPGQTHAFQNSWSYMDLNGNWHTTKGIRPTQPMFKAAKRMTDDIVEIAREVFS